jgi:hypothetical protein
MNVTAQLPLGPDAVRIADQQHAQHQFGIDRRAAYAAVVVGKHTSRALEVQHRIELSQEVVGRHVIVKSELIKQLFLRTLPSHHRRCSRRQSSNDEIT